MVFKRRDRKPTWRAVLEFFWPRGGWARAAKYVKHRLHRLPDPPEKIARGIWAGVFTTFTPFYGMHFVVAGTLAWIMRGNILAALLATFFGNPLTYIPIGIVSLNTGYFLLGGNLELDVETSLGQKFVDAGDDLTRNLWDWFQGRPPDWSGLQLFWHDVFYPYMIGGIIPGIIVATICYFISEPLIRAYQARRKGVMKKRFDAIKAKAAAKKAAAKAENGRQS
ncbi:DUF2062 domain-containing protein [Primorskyibacter aestuariivivens]|uniref:DUF2062 domain-containing protein n=1 Tax=Primorskyibacter aestuariivivens TaxID=1888912 RepID=UPI00230116CD|nr:DUF2062 domain-containing protein [Primorskyibacter aestuariivivens]MDA7430509.1 DUF2062 domain-containing protein [Primorskyibacter aestuariivivens]